MNIYKNIILLICLSVFSLLAKNDKKLHLVHADRLLGKTIGEENQRVLEGNVVFTQGNARLTCDRAIQFLKEGQTILFGHVTFIDSIKSLYGDKVTHYESMKNTVIEGNVKLVDSSKTLCANTLRYFDEEEKAVAHGKVVLSDSSEKIDLFGEFAEYQQKADYAKVTGNSVLVKKDSTEEKKLVITGKLFEMFDDGEKFFVTDSVKVTRGEIEAFCDTLEYLSNENVIKLVNLPKVHQGKQYLTGQSVSLLLKDSDVTGIHIIGNAIATSNVDSTIQTDVPYDLLSGQDMMVYVTDEKIDSVKILERATSYYHVIEDGQEKGLNKALGDAIFITFKQDTLNRVKVASSPSSSTGAFYPPSHQSVLERELAEELAKLDIKID